jgi:hypothetical protein
MQMRAKNAFLSVAPGSDGQAKTIIVDSNAQRKKAERNLRKAFCGTKWNIKSSEEPL